MKVCPVCEEEAEEFKYLMFAFIDVFGGASRYLGPQKINDICVNCYEKNSVHIKDIVEEYNTSMIAAAFTLYQVERKGLARRSQLEDLAYEEVSDCFNQDMLHALKAGIR